jgi:hypothetical protein
MCGKVFRRLPNLDLGPALVEEAVAIDGRRTKTRPVSGETPGLT